MTAAEKSPAWITMLEVEGATGELAEAFHAAKTPSGSVDNVLRIHSLRPKTMKGHMALYLGATHSPDNTLDVRVIEAVASYVSILNNCEYSTTHHFLNLRRLLRDNKQADAVFVALKARRPEERFDGLELALLRYAEKLTLRPGEMVESDVQLLRDAGADDGQILEANQVIGYFNYANRTLNGLGVSLQGDTLGFYEEDDGTGGTA